LRTRTYGGMATARHNLPRVAPTKRPTRGGDVGAERGTLSRSSMAHGPVSGGSPHLERLRALKVRPGETETGELGSGKSSGVVKLRSLPRLWEETNRGPPPDDDSDGTLYRSAHSDDGWRAREISSFSFIPGEGQP
jgi:hypothetical protein